MSGRLIAGLHILVPVFAPRKKDIACLIHACSFPASISTSCYVYVSSSEFSRSSIFKSIEEESTPLTFTNMSCSASSCIVAVYLSMLTSQLPIFFLAPLQKLHMEMTSCYYKKRETPCKRRQTNTQRTATYQQRDQSAH